MRIRFDMCSRLLVFMAVLLFAPAVVSAKLRVAASTTFVGEVVAAIGGDAVEVRVVYPRDADPHAYEPTPRDIARLRDVSVIFVNGLGLESTLQGPLKAVKAEAIEVSRGIEPRRLGDELDPHVWFDPLAVVSWTTNIEASLVKLDAANSDGFRARAGDFRKQMSDLDGWIRAQVGVIPAGRRVLVTDHDELGYFAARYGFRIVGAVMPGFGTLAEPSARDLAALEETIRREKAPALFASGTVAPALARRVAADTGAKLVILPGCSLGAIGSDTGTLPGYLRVLTARIVEGLR